jgi:hypothetical protein
VLDVRRRREQPTDLFRAENNGQPARLAGRHELVGKIAALQRDLEEEPQGSGTDVDGRYRRSDRRQPQLVPTDVLSSGLVGRPADEICKVFDVADIGCLVFGLSRRIVMSSISRWRNGLMALSVPCPCCGGRMIIIEIFERGCAPRYRPTVPNRVDSS